MAISWENSIDAALKKGKSQNKLVMIDFSGAPK